jgi:hypothetical protein
MPLDLFVFLALLPFITGFLTLERLDFGMPKSFQPGELTQKKEVGLDQTRMKNGY